MTQVMLEPLEGSHLDLAAALWSDPAVIRFTNVERPCGRTEAAERLGHLLECQREMPEPVMFAVRLDGRICGMAGCPPVDAAGGVFGLFYQLLPDCWGRGVGQAAAAQALGSLRRTASEALVLAEAVAENRASVRILERLGFARTGIRSGALRRNGLIWDVCDYRLRWGGQKEECL